MPEKITLKYFIVCNFGVLSWFVLHSGEDEYCDVRG